MKIIYLHQYFKLPTENGGTRSYDLANAFVRKGYDIEVITTCSERKGLKHRWWHTEEIDNIKVNYLFLPYDNSFTYFKRVWVFFVFLFFSTIKQISIKGDLVLATSTPLTIGIPAVVKKIFHKTPYIFEVRDVWPEAIIAIGAIKNKYLKAILFYIEKIIYKYATAIVPLSIDMKKSIDSRYPEFKKKTDYVITNISEIERFSNAKIDTRLIEISIGFNPRFSVLYAGSFGKVNGLNYVVELAKHTYQLDPSIVFILIGDGKEKEKVKKSAEENGVLNNNLFILSPVSKSKLPVWYKAASMGASFVINCPELWANSANKFFDSLAAGRPIVINHGGWQANVISSRNIGYVLPLELDEQNVQKFVDYTYSEDLISNQCNNSLAVADCDYSLEKAVSKYIKIFKSIVK